VFTPTPTGSQVIDARAAVTLPASLRCLTDIHIDQPVVLAAAVSDQLLIVHPAAVAAELRRPDQVRIARTAPGRRCHPCTRNTL
jgi:hypothetical protein